MARYRDVKDKMRGQRRDGRARDRGEKQSMTESRATECDRQHDR